MKKSFSSFLGQVTEALVPSLEEDEETEAVLITADGTLTLTGFYKHLAEMQANDDTYLEEPADELREKYKRWMEVVEQEQFTEPRLAKHLASSTILNEKYVTLVPAKVAHMNFWKRYLFKKALLEDAIANAELAERKAKAVLNNAETCAPNKTIVQTDQPRRATIEEGKTNIVCACVANQFSVGCIYYYKGRFWNGIGMENRDIGRKFLDNTSYSLILSP
uniref:BSD domain-containing protein n=1 Tax=Anopheles maculatus TaxID=74869 RepID=A0A182SMD8_9DIPT